MKAAATPSTSHTAAANRRKAPVAPALAAMPSLIDDALATALEAQFSPEADASTWHEKEHEALRGLHRHIQAAADLVASPSGRDSTRLRQSLRQAESCRQALRQALRHDSDDALRRAAEHRRAELRAQQAWSTAERRRLEERLEAEAREAQLHAEVSQLKEERAECEGCGRAGVLGGRPRGGFAARRRN